MIRRATPLIVALLLAAVDPASGQSFDVVLHVDAAHPAASDGNRGTSSTPLLTIQEAMNRATTNKRDRRSTKVVIGPGIYREAVEFAFTNHPTNQPGNSTPVLVEGAGPGRTVISGSEVFARWRHEGGGIYSHAWPHDWGVADDPSGGYIPNPKIVLRREMVFVGGERMRQVLTASEMGPGTFRVGEAENKLYLQPPVGTDLRSAEVALRERGWYTMFEDNLTLRGFTVQHVASPWAYGSGAVVAISSSGVTVEEVVARQNNYMGFSMQLNANTKLVRSKAVHNGQSGWALWKNTDFYAEEVELSYNNWRGLLGGYTFWEPGNKSLSMHGMTVRGLKAIGNHSRGLWLDSDHTRTLLHDIELRDNLSDGIFIEANQGPITLTNARITDNGGYAIYSASSAHVTLENSHLAGNERGGLRITGADEGRDVVNFETGATFRARSRDWALTRNTIVGGPGPLISTTFGRPAWDQFVSALTSDHNAWWSPVRTGAFEWYAGERITLEEWRRRTGQDQHSTFADPDVPSINITAPADGTVLTAPAQVAVVADVSTPSGAIDAVVFFSGATELGRRTQAPYQYTWRDVPAGTHTLTAKAVSGRGAVRWSAPVTVTVRGSADEAHTSQHIILQQGWNLISSRVRPDEPALPNVFAELLDHVVLVKDEAGHTFIPDHDVNTIGEWSPLEAYEVYMRTGDTLEVAGVALRPEETAIPLKAGWNLVPYLSAGSMSVEEAFSAIASELVIVQDYVGGAYIPDRDADTVGEVRPGQGYKVYVSSDVELTYPLGERR